MQRVVSQSWLLCHVVLWSSLSHCHVLMATHTSSQSPSPSCHCRRGWWLHRGRLLRGRTATHPLARMVVRAQQLDHKRGVSRKKKKGNVQVVSQRMEHGDLVHAAA